MEGFEGMPKNENTTTASGAEDAARASRAPLGLSGKNANPQTLRTFQSDLADTIKSGEASLIKIAMAENRRNEENQKNTDPTSARNKLYIFGGIALVIIALGIIGYAVYRRVPKTVPISQTPAGMATIITVDSIKGVNITGLTRDNIRDEIGRQYLGATPTLNTVERILPFTQSTGETTQRVLTTQDFFTSIESVIPPQLLRSFDPTFTIGVFAFNGNGMFMAFKTNAYTTALAGMLEWEQNLFDETYSMFGISTLGDNANLFTTEFKDKTIKNQDTRALLDSQGKPVLFYTFIGEDKTTLIISNNDRTLEEVLNRLTANTLRR